MAAEDKKIVGNVFDIKVINFNDLLAKLIKNGFCPYEKDGKFYSNVVSIDEKDFELIGRRKNDNFFEENAIFYQISYELDLPISNNKLKPNKINEIVYIDFSTVSFNKYEMNIQALFNSGFKVKDGDTLKYDFKVFDKSASMGRKSRISFLSDIGYKGNKKENKIKGLYNKICERAYLGLTDEIVKWNVKGNTKYVDLAKRYAYRGLMLSGGKRVRTDALSAIMGGFEFNKETVLIVQDCEEETKELNVITEKVKDENNIKDPHKLKFELADYNTKVKRTENINDGYGFITSDLALAIDKYYFLSKNNNDDEIIKNCTINKKNIKEHTSFQIRLPYIKGVVHVVDFIKFIENHKQSDDIVHIQSFDKHLNPCTIEKTLDEMKKVKLIISESMFKCIKELREYGNNHNIDDVLEFYFKKLNDYKHSLFILTMSKANGGVEEETLWNYQYISTVKMDYNTFEKIYNVSKNRLENLKTSKKNQVEYFKYKKFKCLDKLYYEGNSDIDELETNKFEKKYDIARKLLELNEDFIEEPYFRNLIKEEANSIKNYMAIGRLFMNGQDRFLIGDPLKYMYFLFGIDKKDFVPLENNTFMAPGIDPNYNNKKLVVLRNPHLSRNEDLVLKLFVPDENTERYELFKDLNGVCIIDSTHDSLPAETVGGADFDGDHVKIYLDEEYAKAIIDGTDKNKGGDESDGYPLVINDDYKNVGVSKSEDDYKDTTYNKYIVNKNTFNNYVGMISNYALKESFRAYSDPNTTLDDKAEIEKHKDNVRLLGILTGIEVDSAKTGIKPEIEQSNGRYSNIIFDKNETNQNLAKKKDASQVFIKFKEAIINKKSIDSLVKEQDDKAIYDNDDVDSFSKKFYDLYGRNPSNIEMLIPLYNQLKKITLNKSKRNKNLINWATEYMNSNDKPDDSGLIYKGPGYNEIRDILIVYRKLVEEKNNAEHAQEKHSDYYDLLEYKANKLGKSNSLKGLIGKLTDPGELEYIKYHKLACILDNQHLVYNYYPYFSLNDKNGARKWLEDKAFNEKISFVLSEDEYALILSDPLFIFYLLKEVEVIRKPLFELQGKPETEDNIINMVKNLSKNEYSELSMTVFFTLINSHETLLTMAEKKVQNFVNSKKMKTFLDEFTNTLNIIYNSEIDCFDNEIYNCNKFNELTNKYLDKFIEKAYDKKYIEYDVTDQKIRMFKEIAKEIENFSCYNIFLTIFNGEVNKELVYNSNCYRMEVSETLTPNQIIIKKDFKEALKYNYTVENINEIARKKMWSSIINNKKDKSKRLSDDEVKRRIIRYVRALHDVDNNQRFLIDVLGDYLVEQLEKDSKDSSKEETYA